MTSDRKRTRSVRRTWCVTGHVGYVLQGSLEIEFGDGIRSFDAGDGFFIRAGEVERHKPKAIQGPVKLLVVEDV